MAKSSLGKETFRPLTPARWGDLEALFGRSGACGGCWCMWWRLTRLQWNEQKGAGNRRAFKKLVDAGKPTGVLAYVDGKPVAWCAAAPREEHPVLQRSRALKPIDGTPVWSITCFFVAPSHRGRGLTVRLLDAARDYARRGGGRVLEGYPMEPRGDISNAVAWTGLASAFRQAGFKEVARRGNRPIVRRQAR